jgi:hypothetical protein
MHSRPRCLPSSTKHWTGRGNSPSREGVAGCGRDSRIYAESGSPIFTSDFFGETASQNSSPGDRIFGTIVPGKIVLRCLPLRKWT